MSSSRPTSFRAAAAERLAADDVALPASVEEFLTDTRRMSVRLLPVRALRLAGADERDGHRGDAALQTLVASIRQHGVLEPILVRPVDPGVYEVVAGTRRVRAARAAGLETIPAVVRQIDAETAAALTTGADDVVAPVPSAPPPDPAREAASRGGAVRRPTNGTYMPPTVVGRRVPRVISGPGLPLEEGLRGGGTDGGGVGRGSGEGDAADLGLVAGDEGSRGRARFRFARLRFLRRSTGSDRG